MIFAAYLLENSRATLRPLRAALAKDGFTPRFYFDDERFLAGRAFRRFGSGGNLAGPQSDGLAIVADARIDARAELISSLGHDAPQPEASDEAFILAAYRRWGDRCPEYLIGDYAFAIHDPARDRLFCARDHIGARPLFYSMIGGGLVLASDMAALLEVSEVDDALDEAVVRASLEQAGFYSFERTFYRSIKRLPVGNSMILERGRLTFRRYWKPGNRECLRLASPGAYAAELRRLIELAVKDRMRGAKRPGVHVSGGLDSSAVAAVAVAYARTVSSADPVAFSWQPGDSQADITADSAWAGSVADFLGIELHACLPERETIAALIRRDCTRYPDPHNLLNETAVQTKAAQLGVDVMLSGWGGDEAASFNGRGWEGDLLRQGRLMELWKRAVGDGFAPKLKAFSATLRRTAREFLRPYPLKLERSFASRELKRRVRSLPAPRVRLHGTQRARTDLLEAGGTTARMETWYLSGARQGIEYRYPLLDRRILDFCYSVPGDLFVHEGQRRWLFRRAVHDLLPETIRNHAGKFEPVRVSHLERELLPALRTLLSELRANRTNFARSAYIDIEGLERWLEEPRETFKGQGAARVALQLLDFPEQPAHPAQLQP